MAGQYCYVSLGQHLVYKVVDAVDYLLWSLVHLLIACVCLCLTSNVSTTIDPFWDISLDLGPPDFEGRACVHCLSAYRTCIESIHLCLCLSLYQALC